MEKKELPLVSITNMQDWSQPDHLDPKMLNKLRKLTKQLTKLYEADYTRLEALSHALFATFGLLRDDVVIEMTQSGEDHVCYSVSFVNGSIDHVELFINFKRNNIYG